MDREELKNVQLAIHDLIQKEQYDELSESGVRSYEAVQIVIAKHKKAKRLLFKIMNDRIEEWWD